MKFKPVHTFLLILVIFIISVVIALPKNFKIKYKAGPLNIDKTISSPNINFRIGNIAYNNDLQTKLGLDLKGGTQIVYEAQMQDVPQSDRESAILGVKNIIERRVNLFGVSEANIQTVKDNKNYRILVEMPSVYDAEHALSLIGKTAQLTFREAVPGATASSEIDPTVFFGINTPLTGKHLKKSTVVFDPNTGKPQVSLEFNNEGAKLFESISQKNIGKQLAIFLDEQIVSAPVVNETISGGKAVISGSFTLQQAKNMSIQLNSGALPVAIKVVEQKNVGPTLGEESIRKSITAGIIGLGMVIFIMIGNYQKMGILATFALIIYGTLSFALFKLIPITLTLPGISGFLLSVGMAVDANILIFERIKEESRAGKPKLIARELGFGRAWDSIRDANIATLLTCFILFNPFDWNFLITSGSVRGFATTLSIGLVMSLFTGIIVTRTLVRLFYK